MAFIKLSTPIPGPKGRALLDRRDAAVAAGLARATDVVVVRGEGALVHDVDGNTFIDLVGGIGMLAVGHSPPNVVGAIAEQAARLIHTCALVATYEPYVALCEALNAVTPGAFPKKTLLANSGAESVENAVSLARRHTGRSGVICFEGGYHGRTLLALSLTSKYGLFKKGFGPFAPEIVRLPIPNVYRRPASMSEDDYLDWCVAQLDHAFVAQTDPSATAAILIEPVQGEGGFLPVPVRFLARIRELCDEHGIVMIADEVQSGFGRTGRLFAIEHAGVVPDLVVMAKSLGAGMPISAVTGRAEILDAAHKGGVGGTYGGSPVACAAALAAIETIRAPGFAAHAERIANVMREVLSGWHQRYALVGDVRGLGPMMLVELVRDRASKEPAPEETLAIIRRAVQGGVLAMRAGLFSNGIRLLPPLVITEGGPRRAGRRHRPRRRGATGGGALAGAMADLLFHGGTLLTQEPATPVAQALAVRGGRITAVGRDADVRPLTGPNTRSVDLAGRTLIPGFNDAHAHVWKMGHLLTTMVDLRRADGLPALARKLKEAAARLPPGAWLQGRGYNEARMTEGRSPTRWDLDLLVSDRPVVLTRTCGHIQATNSEALRRAGITRDTPDPPGGVIARAADGEPTGLLHETAMGLINSQLPSPSRDDYAAMIRAAFRHQCALGITSTTDAGVGPALLDAYRWLDGENRLGCRVNVMALRKVDGVGTVPLPRTHDSTHLRIDTVKFLADGGLSGGTAALSIAYRHANTRGVLRFDDAELRALAREAHDAGWRIAIHAIGDVTIDQTLRLYEALGPGAKRHRIEHLGLPSADQLVRAAALGVIAVPQAVFLHALGRNFRACLPDELLARAYPIRAMLEAGLTVALSSDGPVVENDDPLRGIRSAVDRRDGAGGTLAPDQAISAAEALYAYTMGGAIASGDDGNRGSLAIGKWADLAILSGNPLTTPVDRLTELVVDQTWIGGRLAYER